MNELRAWPGRGTYHRGQPVQIHVVAPGRAGGQVRASVSHLTTILANLEIHLGNDGSGILEWAAPPDSPRGYGVDVELSGPDDLSLMETSTAFDVLAHWTDRPRYGFVTDFGPDLRTAQTLDSLLPFHVNALQFYDWQFRHDQLVAPQSDYEDPLGRHLSLGTVRSLVKEAGARGMASMAYAAVYAASLDFQRAHPKWALYDEHGRPLEFEGFLGYMDPTPGRPWAEHLLRQCDRAIAELGFDGIHLDQYGEPRQAFDVNGADIDLPSAFRGFVDEFKRRTPDAAVTLNAVKNWPMEELAASTEDFYYVELWPDTPTYREVRDAVTEARAASLGKPVVVAIYVPADQPANVRLVDAVILASGGSRIELGEQGRLLADPYFPKHQPISSDLATGLRRYWDLAVRYGELLFDSQSAARGDFQIEGPEEVWTILRYIPGWLSASLVNLRGLAEARWDQKHPAPQLLENAEMRVGTRQSIARVWWIDPDGPSAQPQIVEWSNEGSDTVVLVPKLSYWGILVCELATEAPA
jgi:dextranase